MTDLNARIELLEHLLKQTQLRPSPNDYREAQIILAGLNDEQKQQVTQRYSGTEYDSPIFLDKVLNMSLPDADFSKKAEINTPMAELLANFQNRQSKKVVVSRRELVRRSDGCPF